MSFIRKKKKDGRIYYYIVENKLVNKKVRQKVLMYLGTSDSLYKRLSRQKRKD
jgi:hypothetical protein